MPTQTAQNKSPSPAERKHQKDMLRLKDEVAANQHQRNKEAAAIAQQQTKLELASDREARDHEQAMAKHELKLALLDPKVAQQQGLNRLKDMDVNDIRGTVRKHITIIAGMHDDAHGDLTDNDNEYRRAKVDAEKQPIKLKDRRKSSAKSFALIDPDLPTGKDVQDRLNSMRLKTPRSRLKKKLTESTQPRDVWFTGTYVPFSSHHANAVRAALSRYQGFDVKIGITGKQKTPTFPLPEVPYNCRDIDEYLGHTMIHYNRFLKTNTPIELKMAVARAAHPDLANKMHWVKDAFATSPTGETIKPGSVVVSDTLVDQAKTSPAYSPISEGKWKHNRQDIEVHAPVMQLDDEGDKLNTSPLRMLLIQGHSLRKNNSSPDWERQLNHLHSQMLGVPLGHPGIEQSKRMFDWMASGWDAVKEAAIKHYNTVRPDSVSESLYLEDRRHAAGVGERLLRAQSLQSVGKRIGTKPSPPTNENILMKRAKRAARYDLRKKLAPNYRNLSTGQKQDIDERIAKHAEFKKLVDTHYKEYKKKYTQKSHASSHNKKPEHTK